MKLFQKKYTPAIIQAVRAYAEEKPRPQIRLRKKLEQLIGHGITDSAWMTFLHRYKLPILRCHSSVDTDLHKAGKYQAALKAARDPRIQNIQMTRVLEMLTGKKYFKRTGAKWRQRNGIMQPVALSPLRQAAVRLQRENEFNHLVEIGVSVDALHDWFACQGERLDKQTVRNFLTYQQKKKQRNENKPDTA